MQLQKQLQVKVHFISPSVVMYARCLITHMTVGKVFIACVTQIKSL